MAKKSKKEEIKLKIVEDSNFCRPSPYVLNLKEITAQKEKIPILEKKENLLSSSFKNLSFVLPLYLLFILFQRFFKILLRALRKVFLFLNSKFNAFSGRIIGTFKMRKEAEFYSLPVKNKVKFFLWKFKLKWPFSLPCGWKRATLYFLVISFILILPFQVFSYYGRFENFLNKNKLDKLNFGLFDVLKFLPEKETVEKAFLFSNIGKKILGYEGGKRYLVIFQNSNEIRPTGGFMGSFALVDVLDGKIKKMEIPPTGSYALQGWLKENVLAPEPLHLIATRWEFQDANWFPDFPTSAKKIIWFYTKSGGPSVDGVIAITSNFFRNILKVVGPIEMPDYGKVINSENFDLEIQKAVEIDYDKKENKPKKIIADLAPKIIEKIFSNESERSHFAQFVTLLNKALAEKDVLFYFENKEIQNAVSNLGWAGEIKNVSEDYLMVVDTNIAGQKTDAVILNKIHHLSLIEDDGSIIDTVTITKSHQGKKGEIFTGVRNVDYLRIYVPEGSELIEADGFEAPPQELFEVPEDYLSQDIDLKRIESQVIFDEKSKTRINNEFGKTVFGNWVQIDPGETKTVSFTYRLPFRLPLKENKKSWLESVKADFRKETIFYSVFVQKQPGSRAEIVSEVKFPYNWQFVWKYPEDLKIKDSAWLVHDKLETDRFYGALFEIK